MEETNLPNPHMTARTDMMPGQRLVMSSVPWRSHRQCDVITLSEYKWTIFTLPPSTSKPMLMRSPFLSILKIVVEWKAQWFWRRCLWTKDVEPEFDFCDSEEAPTWFCIRTKRVVKRIIFNRDGACTFTVHVASSNQSKKSVFVVANVNRIIVRPVWT